MSEIVIPRKLASQPKGLYYRAEMGGLTFDNQPVPWCADAVVVEALLRLPSAARRRTDFSVRTPGFEAVAAEHLKVEDDCAEGPNRTRHRLFFRLPVPKATCEAELHWKSHILGRLEIPVVSRDRFLDELRFSIASTFVNIDNRSVAAQTFVSSQIKSITASVLAQSPTGLGPLMGLGLTATFHAEGTTIETAVPLCASQLTGRETLVTAIPPKLPKNQGEWTITWSVAGRNLATNRLRGISAPTFVRSLRVSDTRFGVLTSSGVFRVLRSVPQEGVAKVGPCFYVASNEPGMAALGHFAIHLKLASPEQESESIQVPTLITDGPTPVVARMFAMEELAHATAFELRIGTRTLAVLPLSPVPAATLNSEGGFKPALDFTWTATADDELSERLAKLMENPG